MAKVEDDFMANAPENFGDIERFLKEIPYWTAKKHGKKYRFMYQVYTSPKYRKYGTTFFKGVTERYTEYQTRIIRTSPEARLLCVFQQCSLENITILSALTSLKHTIKIVA